MFPAGARLSSLCRPGSIDRSFAVLLYLFDQIDTCEQVHAKIYEGPLNALPRVLLLFEDKHVVVEELLQLLVGKVDAELLEAVELFESKK